MLTPDGWTLTNLSKFVEWANVAVALTLAFRLIRTGLCNPYRMLTAYLVFTALVVAGSEFIPRKTNLYAEVYMAVTPMHWVLYFAVAYEAYRRVLEDHRGLLTAGRWVVSGGLALSIVVTAVTLMIDLGADGQKFPLLFAFHVAERAISTVLALLLAILLGFLLYFPVLSRRNSILLVTGLAALFLCKALLLLLRNLMGPDTYLVLSMANQVLALAVVSIWLFRLVPQSVDQAAGPTLAVPQERAEEMLRRLGQMNELLLRGSGR